MKYGVVFPQIEFGNDPEAIKDYAQAAESLGYDYLLVYDHVLGPTRTNIRFMSRWFSSGFLRRSRGVFN